MTGTPASDTIVVFTARPLHRILEEGGTQAWKVNPVRARQFTWVVCTRNRHHSDLAYSEGERQQHGAAFLIGRIANVLPPNDGTNPNEGRYLVAISEYAELDVPN